MNIFFLHGADNFRSSQALRQIKERFEQKNPDLNVVILTSPLTANNFSQAVQTLGLFGEKRLVIVKNIFSGSGTPDNFLPIVQNIPPDTFLVFHEDKEIKTKSDFFQYLQKKAEIGNYNLNGPVKLKTVISAELNEEKKSFDEEAIELLISWLAKDPWRLYHELEKLKLSGAAISQDLVRANVIPTLESNIFSLGEAVVAKEQAAFQILDNLLAANYDPNLIFGVFSNSIRQLGQIVSSRQTNPWLISLETKVPYFVVKKIYHLKERLSAEKISRLFGLLLDYDFFIKTGKIESELGLTMVVAEIMTAI